MNTAITTPAPLRLLLIKTSSMGDLVHTLSVVEEARQHLPSLAIDWVAEEAFVEVAKLSPAVARVIPVGMRRWRHALFASRTRHEIRAFVRELRGHAYDCVIDAQGLVKSAWITALARCPSRAKWGFDRASIREPLAAIALHHRAHVPTQLPAIERLRLLFGAALHYTPSSGPALLHSPVLQAQAPHMAWPAMPASLASSALAPDALNATPRFVIFVHGTSRSVKAWAIEEWSALARAVAAAGLRVALPWGSAQEREAAEQIAQAAPDAALVLPKQGIGAIAAMMMSADAVVGVDSGLMHLAAALGRPTVAVMPAGLSQRYSATRFAPPWTSHVRVVVPASDQSMIDAQMVQHALSQVLHS